VFSGIASVVIAFNLRKIKQHPGKLSDELKSKIEEVQAEIEQQIK
jgi:BMFP domain-containing protein YqiC